MPETDFSTAMLGLGGNIADPVRAMATALQALDQRADCSIVAVSKLYRTPPWGKTDQAFFFNACAAIRTSLPPETLLDVCLDIERGMKRERIERWGPRTIDIDILTYGAVMLDTAKLQIPHARMTERGFVLMPLADIAADLVVAGNTVTAWLANADIGGIEVADADSGWWQRS
ncbi:MULTISPECIES: 2-amino-4-hydroxy-6-hydroxymethyldihydropteridine diphosphokinase [Rhizobium]|uniref:2-amino-4-hydroxy-6-hydroxymethyldihydropteridine pyrophosphokinase n=1 Tax=Rhizobium rhododendri TaxID=2506430 RepID=A0ABY8IKX4_9HYPH|nr:MULTISPECIES: 2-amino-4-hydroxy-6-hydroxymethyldihydropteridine diphosphokinase [Rhizobium]MBZ5758213.1 2-amino-4-hydroxy-6-hydroxymethyldihydropteridine diphosphokinase [Rhizobium sp. VS19-DR96]MBZ5764957.1 2-amino-4-hydroxy-6-hydroxymethyldihydropteridine diphosphokinase [Rhizobium sp. VS19-DR129.2]MBZ5772500.1 2-amino-4-hydroxy-6-hydroxymethyldihydropteridine diphosphokinase [Rhizobium sp. VS19-DRK62.2]MBZ5782813.1 2-amino-4-hydroxy-6-hydroxymethyldihydropteridine diphosphokinase [Rhizobi